MYTSILMCVCFIHDSESLKIDRVLWCSLLGLHSHDWFPAAIHGMAPSYVLYIYIDTLYTLYTYLTCIYKLLSVFQ